MTKSQFLAHRLREVFLCGKWIANTNFKEQLSSITCQQATQKIGNLNTIALLTFHVNYYLQGLLQVLKGGKLEIHDKYSFDMPEIKTDQDWIQMVNTFLTNAESFARKVEELEESVFDQPFVNEKYGNYWRNIEGVIEHSYYHLGQIALIRKLLTTKNDLNNEFNGPGHPA